jgi:hypothetical protein
MLLNQININVIRNDLIYDIIMDNRLKLVQNKVHPMVGESAMTWNEEVLILNQEGDHG